MKSIIWTTSASTSQAYTYNNAGLASVTGPPQYGSPQVSYTVDHTGAATSVTGSGPTSAPVYAQSIQYRASGGLKSEAFGNGRSLSVTYDNRLRVKRWDVAGVMGWDYSYTDFGENTRRVTYAQNLYDSTLSRSYDYDAVGRLLNSYTGTEALAHTGRGGAWGVHDGPYSQAYLKDEWGNVTRKWGRDGDADQFTATYTNNRRDGFTYDSSGNLIYDGGQTFTYDATGQQASASYGGYSLQNAYDGNGLRVKKVENGVVTYYVRSSLLGGRVIVETNSTGGWYRGYVYDSGGGLIGIQANGVVTWAYEEPATKSQRLADASGNVMAAVDLDPWGLETSRSWNSQQQTHRYTTYERDGNQSDDAMMRRYNRWHLRFDQPDPYDGSYDITSPQSLNRYTYTNDDPVNNVDPTGAMCFNVIRTDIYTDTGEVIGSAVVGTFCTGWGGYFGNDRQRGGNSGTSAQRPNGVTRSQLEAAIDRCLQKLSPAFSLGSFTPTEKRKDGRIDVIVGDPRVEDTSTIRINNSVAYSSGELGNLVDQHHGSPLCTYNSDSIARGYTPKGNIDGYTANDADHLGPAETPGLAALVGPFVELQLHELARGLGNAMGKGGDGYHQSGKPGNAGKDFTDCALKELKGK